MKRKKSQERKAEIVNIKRAGTTDSCRSCFFGVCQMTHVYLNAAFTDSNCLL